MNLKDYISELDSNRFGFLIAKLSDNHLNIEILLNFLRNNNVKLVLTKIPCENIDLINTYEQNGFIVKDFQVTYRYDLNKYQEVFPIIKNDIIIRDAEIKDIDQLEIIASSEFFNYGHYSADKKLDINKCNEIYVDWVRNSLTNSEFSDKFIVAEFNNEIAGFLTFKIFNHNEFKYAAGGIGAVSNKYKNQSIFKQVSQEGIKWAKVNNFDWVEHNVLVINYPVNRSFTNQGFKIYKSFLTMHCWL